MARIRLSDHFTYKKLLRFALPTILMMIFVSIYGIVDGFFVSNYAGKQAFAAVNIVIPFLMVLGSLGFILGAGGSALIGKTLGEGDRKKASQLFSMVVVITVIAGIAIAVVGMLVIRPVAVLLKADEAMIEYCVLYGRIVLISLPAHMLQFEFESLFVVAEKPKIGLANTVTAGVSNMILDWFLVGVFDFGVAGAAAATAASQFIGGILPLIYFARKNTSLLRLTHFTFDGRALIKILTNGSSEFVSTISMSVVSMLYNAQLMKYAGEDGVAAYGAIMYLSFIFIAVFVGYSNGTAAIVSFNYGAGNTEELQNLFRKSLTVIMTAAVVMTMAGELVARPFSSLYVGYDADLMALTVRAFRICSISFLFCAIPIYGSSFFTALNNGAVSATISFLRTVVFEVASVMLLPRILGTDGIWGSWIVAEVVAAIMTVIFLIAKRRKYQYW